MSLAEELAEKNGRDFACAEDEQAFKDAINGAIERCAQECERWVSEGDLGWRGAASVRGAAARIRALKS